jgi:anthranilate phosphoribosyltransferase
MSATQPTWPRILHALVERRELLAPEIAWVMEEMMQGRAGDAETAAFLLGLRVRGETPGEVAEAARVLRSHMLRWDPGRDDVLDTCGTGGDQSGAFNISTATAFVLAGAGVPVVKHGNRSVSSQSGSADVLAALGVSLEVGCDDARRQLQQAGLAFCFAPNYHPALRHVAAVRKRLGVPSLFNLLGPLANPAGARRQLLGVGQPALLDLLAEALARLGTEHALVVHGAEGLDEVSLAGPTDVREVKNGTVRSWTWTSDDFGLEPVPLSQVRVADPQESAAVVLEVLRGTDGPALRLVLANAAAGLLVAGKATTLRDGVTLARVAVVSGNALGVLERLRK